MKRQMLQQLGAKDGKSRKRHRSDDDHHRSRRHRSKSRSRRRRSASRDRDDRRRRMRSASSRRDRDRRRRTRSVSPRPGRDQRRTSASPDARPTSVSRRPSSRDRRPEHPRPPRYSDPRRDRDKPSTRGLGKTSPLAHPAGTSDEERARRLAEMQSNASALDADRARRLATLAEQEQAKAAADDAVRRRNTRLGGRADFLASVNRKAAELDLGDRVSRGRQGLVLGD